VTETCDSPHPTRTRVGTRTRTRARTHTPTRTRTHRAATALALITVLLASAACGAGSSDRAGTDGSDRPASTLVIHLVRSAGTDAYVEAALLDRGQDPADLTDAVRLSVEGLLVLTGDERGGPVSALLPDLTSSVPPGVRLLGVSIEDGLVTVDLGGELRDAGGSSLKERTFAQQLAHTALLDASLTGVRLLVDGTAVTELWGHLDWSEPLLADPSALSPITIEEPGPATVTSGTDRITVRGRASVPGGRVLLRLEDPAGNVVAEATVTATAAAPARGSWSWDVRLPGAGDWVIVARAEASSDVAAGTVFETRRSTASE
jgi:hypothetical protein